MALGIARRSIEVMNKYASERAAFGHSINRYGQIQRLIADSYAEYAAGRAYVYNTARSLDLSKAGNRIDSDGVKLYCSVMGTTVANRAMQVIERNHLLRGPVCVISFACWCCLCAGAWWKWLRWRLCCRAPVA
jgi:alkylation response protein AidB-like acyl-CoA dehydrogenase